MLCETVSKGNEEQKQDGSSSIRSSPYKKSKRWDLRGEDVNTQKHVLIELSQAMAQVVGENRWRRQPWFEQQRQIEEIKGFGRLKLLDEETLSAIMECSPGDDDTRARL